MTDDLYFSQIELEKEMRLQSRHKFHKDLEQGSFSETAIGTWLTRQYINPISQGIDDFIAEAGLGKAGRQNSAARVLSLLPSDVVAYLGIKAILNLGIRQDSYDRHTTLTSLAMRIGYSLNQELRMRKFETENSVYLKMLTNDFNKRELPTYKRIEYLQKVAASNSEEWDVLSPADRLHAGMKVFELYKNISGDMTVRTTSGKGKHKVDTVEPSESLITLCEKLKESQQDLCSVWYPMVHQPEPWCEENLDFGGYLSHHVTPYKLVKGSRAEMRRLLKDLTKQGKLEVTLSSLNAMQNTPWTVNKPVLDAIQYVYDKSIPCGKLPRADPIEMEPAPKGLDLSDRTNPKLIEYFQYRAITHEFNRKVIGKRVLALRALQTAERFAAYERIYFPHDLDSRGRAYPKPSPLNPQGPDYVKGLLKFADGKRLGTHGFYWLGVHGANCFGEDKAPIAERAAWSQAHIEQIKACAANPKINLWWTTADSPAQFLAFCFEYAEAHGNPVEFVSYLHVDLDATCSGLQHFSAMLRDPVGGLHVNMVPNPDRQDVYGAVASVAKDLLARDAQSKSDTSAMSEAWLSSGLMNRSLTKRPVMVKPYAGTFTSCMRYVASEVDDQIKEGLIINWPKDDLAAFKVHGAKMVWEAIPKVVVAADDAMRWLSSVARAVGSSQMDKKRIEWVTPVGFPVYQYKFNMKSRRVDTHLDGKLYRPRLSEETDQLDSRSMASSIPPSFVHSLDACHLQLTVYLAAQAELKHFACVHDSFGVHAADIHIFAPIIRQAFVRMYQDDVLANFLESARPHIAPDRFEQLDPIPDKGDLDLSGVLSSEYFFS